MSLQYHLYYYHFYDILTVIEWKPSNSKGSIRRGKKNESLKRLKSAKAFIPLCRDFLWLPQQ